MDRFVARLNIDHYRTLLARETDAGKRDAILKLLAEEERTLAILDAALKKLPQ